MTLKNQHDRKLGIFATIDEAVAALFDWRLTGTFRIGRTAIDMRRVNTALVAVADGRAWGIVMD